MGGENELRVNDEIGGDESSCAKQPVLSPNEASQSEERRHLEKKVRSDSTSDLDQAAEIYRPTEWLIALTRSWAVNWHCERSKVK